MPSAPQTYENHTRWNPLYHFVATPIVSLYAIYVTGRIAADPTRATTLHALWAIGVAAGIWAARDMALRVQNRVIRLEMRLRLRELLPAAVIPRINELTVRQLVALRFAGDAELPGLVDRVLKGEFARPRDIKRAVRDWQADYLRA
jgi:hypothetical protein